MIYTELNEHSFAYELSKDSSFTYYGAMALYNYLEGFGEDIEFDAVALRCEYTEYTLEEYKAEFPDDITNFADENGEYDDEELIGDLMEKDGYVYADYDDDIIIFYNY